MKEKIDDYDRIQEEKAKAEALKEAEYERMQEKKAKAEALKEAEYERMQEKKAKAEALKEAEYERMQAAKVKDSNLLVNDHPGRGPVWNEKINDHPGRGPMWNINDPNNFYIGEDGKNYASAEEAEEAITDKNNDNGRSR